MSDFSANAAAAVLVSGGIDSAVLLAELSHRHPTVFAVFVRGGLAWELQELESARSFLRAIAMPGIQPLVVLDQPVCDVYGDHWSVTGRDVPQAATPDSTVFLPGRTLFLTTKAAVWCVLHGVHRLAIGTLSANPFADSTPEFDRDIARLVQRALDAPFEIVRPFATLTKSTVIRRGAALPLDLTFSCIQPVGSRHCGRCNKCEERRCGFRDAGVPDPTNYAYTNAAVMTG